MIKPLKTTEKPKHTRYGIEIKHDRSVYTTIRTEKANLHVEKSTITNSKHNLKNCVEINGKNNQELEIIYVDSKTKKTKTITADIFWIRDSP